ncbi:hypothetical protein K8B33_15350 [Alcanivorax sp. JB21]|uniref:hypothetical protein n=1 Tax=Alcanivorax limicola TaxID=2874102 RepID=UPI001CC1369E|nr:hypothetical protein [Alcanivorax limicola]MBZ2190485.1 hypothetical protein [Alcanivorax limicola]
MFPEARHPESRPVPMQRFALLLALSLFAQLVLGGCALLRPAQDPIVALDQSIEAQDYNSAWRTAARIDREQASPELRQRLDTLDQDIIRFERTRITRARQLANAGQWREALDSLDQARKHWAHGYAIPDARADIDQRQLRELLATRSRLLISEAEWLRQQQDAASDLERFADPSAASLHQRLARRRAELAEELSMLGEWHFTAGDAALARDSLRAAHRLMPDAPAHPQLAQAEQALASSTREAQQRRSATLQREARARLTRYERSGAMEDLLAARDYIHQHRQRGNLQQEASQVDALCKERFELDLARGDALYASGDYQGAYRHWSAIAPLMPGDRELEKKLERTRRVLTSLEQLRQP